MLNDAEAKLLMQLIVSIILLASGLWVLLHGHYSDDLQKGATGWIGLVAGYWLK